jgi:hypothetical protein
MSLEQKIAQLLEDARKIESLKQEQIEESITHIVAKKDLQKHKDWMESEGYHTDTKPLPASHPKSKTHVGIVGGKDVIAHSYHEDGYARPIKEDIETEETMSIELDSLTEEDLDAMSQEEFDELVENMEQLDELSLETLKSYRKKAEVANQKFVDSGGDSPRKRARHINSHAAALQRNDRKITQKERERERAIQGKNSKLQGVAENMTIDLASLFEGEEYSEEFKSKVAAVFEAAVEARVKQEAEAIAEELVEHSLNENEQLKEGLVDKVDGYLDYVVEQWMQKNELALDRGIKVEIFESFIAGMKGLFETHNIAVPDEQIDLMEEVDAKAKELEAKLDEATAQNVQLSSQLKEITKQIAIQEATKGLSDLEAERFMQLAEELAYDDEDSFTKKLDLIKENLVKTPKQKAIVESVVTDSPVELTEETQIDPRMQRYLRSIKG